MNDSVKWIWMQQQFQIGTRQAHLALSKYQNPDYLLGLTYQEIDADNDLTNVQKKSIKDKNFDLAMEIYENAKEENIGILTIEDEKYPNRLKSIYSPPFILFYKGDIKLLDADYHISMVGTRNPDEYGQGVGYSLAYDLASAGAVVVSGLAIGIDIACHVGAMASNGKTIGVSVCGLDIDYPSVNKSVREEIENSSLVISEFAPKTGVFPFNFKIRNRIISGLSQGTIIVQCKRKSGTMLTAVHALAQDRDLYAVPGDIFSPISEGPNSLLLDGAEPALSAKQIMSRYVEIYGVPLNFPEDIKDKNKPKEPEKAKVIKKKHVAPDSLDEKQLLVFTKLLEGNQNIDTLADKTDLESFEILSVLTQLEISGIVTAVPGGIYQLI